MQSSLFILFRLFLLSGLRLLVRPIRRFLIHEEVSRYVKPVQSEMWPQFFIAFEVAPTKLFLAFLKLLRNGRLSQLHVQHYAQQLIFGCSEP